MIGSSSAIAQQPQRQLRAHQPLLGAVVEVALEPLALLVGGPHEPGARLQQPFARVRARQREPRQLGERVEPRLGVVRQPLARDHQRAPHRRPRRAPAPRRSRVRPPRSAPARRCAGPARARCARPTPTSPVTSSPSSRNRTTAPSATPHTRAACSEIAPNTSVRRRASRDQHRDLSERRLELAQDCRMPISELSPNHSGKPRTRCEGPSSVIFRSRNAVDRPMSPM